MKNTFIYKISAILLLSLGLVACDNYLDELPDKRMELKTPEEVSKLLISAYPTVNPAYLLEMYSDNTDEHINTGWTETDKFQTQAYNWEDITEISDDETPQELWNGMYSAIAAANASINYIEGLSEDEQADYTQQLGEAYLCRAYSIFTLANVFCEAYDVTTADSNLGVPYPTEPENKIGVEYERGTLAETYHLIDEDIQKGLPLLSDQYDHPKFHFTPSAGAAFAAHFYLYYQMYEKSIEYATEVLGSTPADALRDWSSWYDLSVNGQVAPNAYISSSEKANLLLQVVYSQWGAISGNYYTGCKYAHGTLISTTETLQATGPWGSSSNFGYTVFRNDALSKAILRKIPYDFEYTDLQAGIGYAHSEFVLFSSDLTLIERAEAYALLGQYDNAVADLNSELSKFSTSGMSVTLDGIKSFYSSMDYYTPSNPTPKKKFNTTFSIDSETQEPVLDAVLQLKRILTLYDGVRMQDIKRYGIEIYRRQLNRANEILALTDSLKADDPRRAIQLPQDVITAGLSANPRN